MIEVGPLAERVGLPRRLLRPNLVIVVALILGTMQTMIRTLVAPYATDLGAGALIAGGAVAAYSLPGALLAVPTGSLADKLRPTRFLLLGTLAFATGALLAATVALMTAVFVSVFVMGIGSIIIGLGIQRLATRRVAGSDVDNRGVAGYGVAVLVGHLIGPTLGGVLADGWGYWSAFLAIFCFCIVLAAVLGLTHRRVMRSPEYSQTCDEESPEEHTEVQSGSSGTSYRRAGRLLYSKGVPAAIVLSSTGGLIANLRNSFLPLYLDGVGWSASAIGLVLSSAALTAIVSRSVYAFLERRVTAPVLLRSSVIGGAAALALAVAGEATATIVVGTALSGMLLSSVMPSSLTVLGRVVATQYRGLALGMRLTANRIAQALAPIGFGGLAAATGVRGAFLVFTVLAGSIGLSAHLGRRREPTSH